MHWQQREALTWNTRSLLFSFLSNESIWWIFSTMEKKRHVYIYILYCHMPDWPVSGEKTSSTSELSQLFLNHRFKYTISMISVIRQCLRWIEMNQIEFKVSEWALHLLHLLHCKCLRGHIRLIWDSSPYDQQYELQTFRQDDQEQQLRRLHSPEIRCWTIE